MSDSEINELRLLREVARLAGHYAERSVPKLGQGEACSLLWIALNDLDRFYRDQRMAERETVVIEEEIDHGTDSE